MISEYLGAFAMKNLTSLSQEKRVFTPNPELASHAAIRSMDAYHAL